MLEFISNVNIDRMSLKDEFFCLCLFNRKVLKFLTHDCRNFKNKYYKNRHFGERNNVKEYYSNIRIAPSCFCWEIYNQLTIQPVD